MKHFIEIITIYMIIKASNARPYDSIKENANNVSTDLDNNVLSLNKFKTEDFKNVTISNDNIRICPFNKQSCDLNAEGLNLTDVQYVIKRSSNYSELLYLWKRWHEVNEFSLKTKLEDNIELLKNSSLTKNYKNAYKSEYFKEVVEKIWMQISPLYFELHRYVKQKLEQHYGVHFNNSDGLIPAHLVGSVSTDNWLNLYDILKPYPEIADFSHSSNLGIPEALEIVNNYYTSMGLANVVDSYNLTVAVGKDIEINCDSAGYLLPTCDLIKKGPHWNNSYQPFYQLGHFHYHSTNSKTLLVVDEKNIPFIQGVGDLISLLSLNPLHIEEINSLLEDVNEEFMNFFMKLALKKIVLLCSSVIDFKWKWDILNDDLNIEEYGSRLWLYKEKIQKIENPFLENDLIPSTAGASFTDEFDALNYLLTTVLEFQLYRSLCIVEKEYDEENPSLYSCDLYGSFISGDIIREGLKLSSILKWSDVLFNITGDVELSADALMEYFEPLYVFLKEHNGPLTEDEFSTLLENEYEEAASLIYKKQVMAEWDSAADINNITKQELQLKVTLEVGEFEEHYRKYYFQDLNEFTFGNEFLGRQASFLGVIGNSALDSDKLSELTNVTNTMTNIYNTAKVCPFENQDCDLGKDGLSLEPDLVNIFSNSTNHDELLYLWVAWRDATGNKMKDLYQTYVSLSNEAAIKNGFADMAQMWISGFESSTFVEDMDELWEQVKPLYEELHNYVSNKLQNYYGDVIDISDNLIPAHVLGNMWSQTWINIRDIVRPFPNATGVDITSSLLHQNYTVLKMFEAANDFYQSLGLDSAAMSYNSNITIIEKPANKEIECHGSAWDFYDRKDFRIKMCSSINYEDFVTIHHEMGHIQYYMLYKDQPISFRNGANPGFHEAIGDVITLAVTTPQHLNNIGLLNSYEHSYESSINNLMDMALDKVAFLPFGYLIDKWRWDIFKGSIPPGKWNAHWWYYRKTIQKVKPPVERNDNIHFDAGAKFHVPSDYQFISYFVAHILQFQLYKSFCILAGQYDPSNSSTALHRCDFYNSTEVGNKLRAGLSLGASKHWRAVLKEMSNETDYNASALMEYFAPLYQYLVQTNRESAKLRSGSVNKSIWTCSQHLKYYLLLLLLVFLIL